MEKIVDIIIILCIGYHAIKGYKEGVFKRLIEILGLIGGVILAIKNYKNLALFLSNTLNIPLEISLIVSFILIWLACYILSYLLNTTLTHSLSSIGLGPFTKTLGALLGILRSLIFLIPILWILHLIDPTLASKSYILNTISPYIINILEK